MDITNAAATLGRKGGQSKSDAKAEAARRNARKGGRRPDAKYYAWASNDQGAHLDIVLPMSERRRSQRAYEDAARNQLGSGWTVHIMRVDIDADGQSVLGQPYEIKTFRIR